MTTEQKCAYQNLEQLQKAMAKCRHCQQLFGFEPRPVGQGHDGAPILQISQAPGRKVHESGIPFDDVSGRKLRQEWYQIKDGQFYDPDLFYITTAGHCYPGRAKSGSGDARPPKCCWDMWTRKEIELKRGTQLVIVIGQEAAGRLFPGRKLSDLVFEDLQVDGVDCFVLPHPSPLNRKWLKDHPEFEGECLPKIRERIHSIIRTYSKENGIQKDGITATESR